MEAVEDSIQDVPAQVVKRLKAAVGEENVKTSKFERLLYSHDLAPLPKEVQLAFKNVPDVVVKPTSTEDVKNVVRIAKEAGIPVTPRGSATWGLGGAMSAFGGIMLDISGSMNKIERIDKDNLYVTAQAGATWKEVYDRCLEEGLLLGAYPSSFPSATLAGWISTAGIGVGGYKYGSAGHEIRNLEVVMPDGSVVETGFDALSDNGAGYNLNWLMVGAEGTLGIITKVTFRLEPGPEEMRPLAYDFPKLEDMGEPLMELTRSRSVHPLHILFYDGAHFEMLRKAGKDAPEVGSMLFLMLEGAKSMVDLEEENLDAIMEKHGGKKLSQEIAEHEWEERCYEFRAREIGLGHIPGEVVVATKDFSRFARDTFALMDEYKMEGGMTGMLQDRNTVMFMPYYFFDPENPLSMTSFSFNKKFADLSFEYGGRPLGLGIFFASNLGRIRGEAGAKLMKTIKNCVDPKDIMNPGTLLATVTRQKISIPSQLFNLGMNLMAAGKKMMPRDDAVKTKAKEYEIEKRSRWEH
ncbi:MAG: FAD-binding oxidoreductase [Methanomassiliicoccales archaeon]